MIIAILILIAAILLFGAGAVKGWLANALGISLAFIVVVGLMIWVGSFFGENGFAYVMLGTLGLLFLVSCYGNWYLKNR